jgi:DNA-binding NarL/FixJ family response regulator
VGAGEKIRILLVEDHETVRVGVKLILSAQADMDVVGEAGDGREAIARAQELSPDLVVMDVSMPGMSGLKATGRLLELCPQTKVLMLTRHTDDGYLQELLRAGASGYVLKQSAPGELVRAIRAVVAGGKYLDPAITGKVLGNYVSRSATLRGDTQGGQLSDREAEVLRLIAWGHSNKEIAARLDLSVKTVEAHKANAMRKLDMHSRIDIVRFAVLQGWLELN